MKSVALCILSCLAMNVPASSQEQVQSRARSLLYLGAGTSLINSYSGGNLVDFLENVAGREVTLGTAWGIFPIQAGVLFPFDDQGGVWFGVELQFIATNSQAIATFSVFGGYTVFLNATFVNIALPIGFSLDREGELLLLMEPGLDLGIMGGSIKIGNNLYEQSAASGLGGHIAFGANYAFGGGFAMTTRIGYRLLSIPEVHKDMQSSTGYQSFYVNGVSGETVKVGWNGMYITGGLTIGLSL